MADTGIVRRVDDLGRIVIPMELRRTLGINVKDPLSISVDGEKIILQKHRDSCVVCVRIE
jgi:transcriptional pleiotropic regulator of transition state genes